MAVSDSILEGRFFKWTTSSTTSSVLAGRIVEFNTNGSVIVPTTTPVRDNVAGVSASKVPTRTSATEEDIVIQTAGMAHVVCAANSAFTVGNVVRTATVGTGAGYASTAASATTITSTALAAKVGRVIVADATTEGTTIVMQILL